MGLRGPIRSIESERGKREKVRYAGAVAPPDPPDWLNESETFMFRDLVARAAEANVPLERTDQELYGMMARLVCKIKMERDDSRLAWLIKTLHPLMQQAGLTPMQRARMQGVKKKAEVSPLEQALCA